MIIKNKILISNLWDQIDERTILYFFEKYNFEVKSMTICRGEELENEPIEAVVDVGSAEEVERAINELSGEELEGWEVRIRKYYV